MKNKSIALFAILVSGMFILSGLFSLSALAAKPQNVMEWSNGFPSGEHFNLNIHGKKTNYVCNNSEEAEPFGNSIFVPLNGLSEINFVSNKKSLVEDITVLDPCADPLATTSGDSDPALIQIPTNEAYQVYARILGTPTNKKSIDPTPSVAFSPKLPIACDDIGETVYNDTDSSGNVTPGDTRLANAAKFGYADGSIVLSGDIDGDQNLNLVNFTANETHVESTVNGIFDVGEPIYYDTDNSGNVTAGDIRLANAPTGYDEGIAVASGDSDANDADDLVAFIDGVEMHEETGGTPNMFDYGLVGFGDLTSCAQSLMGIGAVDGENGYGLDGQELTRFASPESKGKGKSIAVNITDMFYWSGFACDPSVDIAEPLGVIDESDLPSDYLDFLTDTEGDGYVDDYLVYLEGQDLCNEHTNEWIFNIADLVLYGWNYENAGAKLVQVRFYPQSTTVFD